MYNFFEKIEKILNTIYNINADAAVDGQIAFQDPVTPMMEGIIELNHYIFMFITGIVVFVTYFLYIIHTVFVHVKTNDGVNMYTKNHLKFVFKVSDTIRVIHGEMLEIIWTILPSFILIAIAFPSFSLLYALDENPDPELTIKAIGKQWYWVYETAVYGNSCSFDSNIIIEDDLEKGEYRLLTVDNDLFIPLKRKIRIVITASDVLHAWTVPSIGLKIDAVPGRLNEGSFYLKRLGRFYGQCSEICGVNHGFMPITVNCISNSV